MSVAAVLQLGWTEPRIAQLKALWAEGRSASDIARELGGYWSRSAVLGKVSRLKLPSHEHLRGRNEHKQQREQAPCRPRKANGVQGVQLPPEQEHCTLGVQLPLEQEHCTLGVQLPPEQERCTLLDLTQSRCRWPIGDPQRSDFFYCGADGADFPTQPYCGGKFCRRFRTTEGKTWL